MTTPVPFILPGDSIPLPLSGSNLPTRLGPGLTVSEDQPNVLVSSVCGLLGSQTLGKEQRWWVESRKRKYTPAMNDPVIGIVTHKHAEGYRVDIGTSQPAALDALAFEGATKRNKPNLKIGETVYARVSLCHPLSSEPEIECYDATTHLAKGFGELHGGMVIRSLEEGRCKELLQNPKLMKDLGKKFAFEVAIGLNGRVWVKADDWDKTREVMELIQSSK
ncbi:hypothetical protein BT69DRAFT_1325112 [Atractiella rhizophila]|nr:hypothetical protein BT69DRAFT_1325112 [Atractiella rhizophila]